jgi:hypothetical protein
MAGTLNFPAMLGISGWAKQAIEVNNMPAAIRDLDMTSPLRRRAGTA